MAFYRIYPMTEDRADLRAASIVKAALGPHLKKGQKLTLRQCALDFEPKKPMTGNQVMGFLKRLTIATKGNIVNGNR
jgi:hypothetical protein